MAKSSTKYYLRYGDEIVDFGRAKAFRNMESFLQLSIFTGLFKDEQDLVETLIHMNLLDSGYEYASVEIVKRRKNYEGNYEYINVTYDIVYREILYFMSTSSIKEFFYKNRKVFPAITEILESYRSEIEKLIDIFDIKISSLLLSLEYATDENKKELEEELEKKRNSLNNFRNDYSNIAVLLSLIAQMSNSTYRLNREVELDYIGRLERFVDDETNYFRKNMKTPNPRGLVKLAHAVYGVLLSNGDLTYPSKTRKYDSIKRELQSAIKSTIIDPPLEDIPHTQFGNIEDSNECEEDDIDPDNYMFLNADDYHNLLNDQSSEESKESVDVDLELLEETKRNRNGRRYS